MEGDNPSTRKRGFSPSKPPTFPSTAWGCRPKTRRRASPCFRVFFENSRLFHSQFVAVFSTFKRIFITFSEHFRPSKILLLLPQRSFGVQKNFCAFLDAISTFKRTFAPFLARFHASKVLLRLSLRVFDPQKYFCGSLRLVFCFQKYFFQFGSNKNQYIKEFLWQK